MNRSGYYFILFLCCSSLYAEPPVEIASPSVPEPQGPEVSGPSSPSISFLDSNSCEGLKAGQIPEPRITITSTESLNQESEKSITHKVTGNLSGVCLVSANYFERGMRKKKLAVELSTLHRSFPFEIQVSADRIPEIRLYNAAGVRATKIITPNL